ncbi:MULTISPECIES: L,D-transpeptidase family protein [unclassified Streptomyces]|uniref:L,D-transpeptidase family protein n=1 Tax=unclassified Streptomyces TaxID=2593676 RepID=UPI002E172CD3|nr:MULTISPECIES: L,D-transpeptidase family protein [unclassified Streptomyces]
MRTAVLRSSIAVTGVLALVGGCKAQAVEGGRAAPPLTSQPSAPDSTRLPTDGASRLPTDDASRPPSDDAKPAKPTKSATPAPAAAKVLFSPGDSSKDVRELQARLRQVAWLFNGPTGTYDDTTTDAVKGFQGKRGLPRTGETDTVTWQRLLKMTHEPGKWELYQFGGQTPAKPDPRCMKGRVVCISKTNRTLAWMVDGKRLMTTEVRFGSEYTPTREGVFPVYFKSRHHVSTLYDSPMPYAMFFSGGQAVHYSEDFAAHGYAGASHGCVNVKDEKKIAQLFAQVRNGDKVVVYW